MSCVEMEWHHDSLQSEDILGIPPARVSAMANLPMPS